MTSIDLNGPADTHALGQRLGRLLQAGDFLGLSGPLGSGKTALVRGIAEGLGIDLGQVSSPTFAIINTYVGGRLPLHHADLYRVESLDELYATGFFDLGEGCLVVEWFERIPHAAPDDFLELRLDPAGGDRRHLHLLPHGQRAKEIVQASDLLTVR
jgi:tRNA threonylcarbamoyladenosine biosynthesis protein TsaE